MDQPRPDLKISLSLYRVPYVHITPYLSVVLVLSCMPWRGVPGRWAVVGSRIGDDRIRINIRPIRCLVVHIVASFFVAAKSTQENPILDYADTS